MRSRCQSDEMSSVLLGPCMKPCSVLGGLTAARGPRCGSQGAHAPERCAAAQAASSDAAAAQAAFLQLRATLSVTRALIGDAALLRSYSDQLQGLWP